MLFFILLMISSSTSAQAHDSSISLPAYTLTQGQDLADWYIVNDGVMGGRSSSRVKDSGRESLLFTGSVSLENNGGFASVRKGISGVPAPYTQAKIRVKGDGKQYELRFAMRGVNTRVSYVHAFDTRSQEWIELTFPLAEFYPSFRGRKLSGIEPLSAMQIRELGFLIANKQAGEFCLEIGEVKLQ